MKDSLNEHFKDKVIKFSSEGGALKFDNEDEEPAKPSARNSY